MNIVKMRWISVSPLLMHNGQLADPQNRWTREIKKQTMKMKGGKEKTDTDLEHLRFLEWRGSLYLNADEKPCLPADNIHAALVEGARKSKQGKEVDSALLIDAVDFALEFKGPKNIEALYNDEKFVDTRGARVGTSRIMRTRPIFRQWSVTIAVNYDESLINDDVLFDAATACGEQIGVGDFTPRFGRFTVERV